MFDKQKRGPSQTHNMHWPQLEESQKNQGAGAGGNDSMCGKARAPSPMQGKTSEIDDGYA